MRSSRVKKNISGDRVDVERTHHNLWCSNHSLRRHMVHSSSVVRGLLVAILLLRCLLIWLLGAMVSIVSHISTPETPIGSTRCTALHRGAVGRSLAWSLIAHLLRCMLVPILLFVLRALWKLTTVPLTDWTLIPLLIIIARAGVASGGLSLHLSLPVPLQSHIVKHNSAIHQLLEISICVTSQLQPEIIVNSLEEETLLVCILPHVIRSIASQLSKLVVILTDRHRTHPERSEFLLLELYQTIWNMVCLEIPHKF